MPDADISRWEAKARAAVESFVRRLRETGPPDVPGQVLAVHIVDGGDALTIRAERLSSAPPVAAETDEEFLSRLHIAPI